MGTKLYCWKWLPAWPVRVLAGLGATLVVLLTAGPGQAAPTDLTMRDPSTIIKRGDSYWIYGTGKGVQQYSSKDRRHWTARGPIFAAAPAWAEAAVPGNRINVMWAPDVRLWNGTYHLYYSFSSLGSNNSAIGLVTSKTLAPNSWQDQGAVIVSQRGGDFNAIDPCIFQDTDGKPWLSYGSYWSGIKLTPLDAQTGKPPADATVTSLASRPGVPGNAIEASAVSWHDGFFYLFVTWNGGGAYNTRMGRAKTPTGPYLDKDGKRLLDGGGSLFLTSMYDNGSGRPYDDQTGPGHVGILHDEDGYWVSTHYEHSRLTNATTVNVNPLIWDADGWPRVILDPPGPVKLVSLVPSHDVLTVAGDSKADKAALESTFFMNKPSQWWTLTHRGGGFYSLVNVGSGKAVTVIGDAKTPGARAVLMPYRALDAQLWFLRQNEDGTYALLNKGSGQTTSLEIVSNRSDDGAPVSTWTSNDLPGQRWSFRTR